MTDIDNSRPNAQLSSKLSASMQRIKNLLIELDRDCDAATIFHEIGLLCHKIGEQKRSIDMLSRAHQLAPENHAIAFSLASVLMAIGQPKRAREFGLTFLKGFTGAEQMVDLLLSMEKKQSQDALNSDDIELEGYLVEPRETFHALIHHALMRNPPEQWQIHDYVRNVQKGLPKKQILANLADSAEFKKMAVSWFVCGQARKFLNLNSKFWQCRPSSGQAGTSNKRYILTSFFHPDPANKVRNGLIAKYLQRRTGCRILAMGLKDRYRELNEALARSFQMEGCYHLNASNSKVERTLSGTITETNELRKALLDLSFSGIRLGDLIYDDYLRGERCSTITGINDQLENYFQKALIQQAECEALFNQYPIEMLIVDHTCYLPWGLVTRMAMQKGIPVLSHHGRSSPIIGRLHAPRSATVDYEVKMTKAHFEEIYRCNGEFLAEKGAKIVKAYYVDQLAHQHTLITKDGYRRYDRKELLNRLNLDANKPVVFIMAHTMSDAPHFMGPMLFDDYHHWMQATLEMLPSMDQVNWIIKDHPFAPVYTDEFSGLKMATPYMRRYEHVACCPLDFHPGGLLDCADALVTCRGTAGLEAAVFGKPCVLAGQSAYTGLGFTIEPATVTEYRQALEQLAFPKSLPSDAVQRARCFAYLFFEASRVECRFLPPQPLVNLDPMPDDFQWEYMALRLQDTAIEVDPLYQNLMTQMDRGYPHLLNFDQMLP